MTWVVTGMAAVGALSSMMNNQAKAKAQKQSADVSAAQTQFSPWTHIQPQQFQPQAIGGMGDALVGGLQGGLAGVMHNQANAKVPGTDSVPPPANPQGGTGYLGVNTNFNLNQQPNMDLYNKNPSFYAQNNNAGILGTKFNF